MSIEQTLFNPDDPRLTAYALGELSDPAERAQVEELLAASPEARAELADIRSLTAALTAEYEQERFAAAEETVAANVVQIHRSFWRRHPLGAIAAMLMVGGLAVLFALPLLVHRQAPPLSAVFSVQQKLEKSPSARVAATANDARTADVKATAAPVAATPSSPLLALQNSPPVAVAEPVADPDVRELVVPMDAPTPPDLPPGTHVARGPAPVNGVVGGNPSATGMGGSNPLLLAKNTETHDSLVSDKDTASQPHANEKSKASEPVSPLLAATAPAAAPNNGSNGSASYADTFTGTTTVTGGGVVTRRGTRLAEAQPPAPPNAKRGPVPQAGTAAGRASITVDQNRPNVFASADRQYTAGDMVASLSEAPPAAKPSAPYASKKAELSDEKLARALMQADSRLPDERERRADTADYVHTVENAFLGAKENPLSTFSIDVDTASYAIVRRFIEAGSLPPVDAVRVEEMLNYFPYSDAPPAPDSDKPFAVHLEAAACPWNTAHRLVRIGIKGKEMANEKRPPSNLVFLLDVSGSMMPEERLPLIKRSLRLMVDKLREDDHVAIVVYAGESGLAMPPTSGDHKDAILSAIENLHAGGSTNGASGIKLAYNVARKGFIKGGTNRVILATDGDFNVGVTSRGDLLRLIEDERKDGVFLSVLGVGTDNLKDSTMQTLADHGNGNYNYIDRLEEGRKVLVNQMSGTLVTIAKDVKIQVEFNPAAVASYRLIGYEKRMLKKEDFNNDKIDAGEIGAGHNVTALYEIVPRGQPGGGAGAVDALKYQPTPTPDPADAVASRAYTGAPLNELLTVKMRHKAPDSDTSERSYEVPLLDHGAPEDFANASNDFRFAAAVASFGMVLRDSPYKGDATLGSALELAQAGKGEDAGGYRAGFIDLVKQAQALQRERGR